MGYNNDEKILIRKSVKGDFDAFEKLTNNYQKKIFNIALRMFNNYDDANPVFRS